nr:hypothetical protein CFP56_12693 [Quercus suber]
MPSTNILKLKYCLYNPELKFMYIKIKSNHERIWLSNWILVLHSSLLLYKAVSRRFNGKETLLASFSNDLRKIFLFSSR